MNSKLALINWLLWMRKTSPELFALFKIKYPEIIDALNDTRLGFDWGMVVDVGTKFVETALPIYMQQKQFKQQLKLAEAQMKLRAPAGYGTPTAQPVAQPVQTLPPVSYPQAVAVPVSTPTTTQMPPTTATGQQPLVIRIDKSQIDEVQTEAKSIKNEELLKYLPYALGGAALLLVIMK